jgi:hypothetical protein
MPGFKCLGDQGSGLITPESNPDMSMNLPSSTEDAANSPSNQLKAFKDFTQDFHVMP